MSYEKALDGIGDKLKSFIFNNSLSVEQEEGLFDILYNIKKVSDSIGRIEDMVINYKKQAE